MKKILQALALLVALAAAVLWLCRSFPTLPPEGASCYF